MFTLHTSEVLLLCHCFVVCCSNCSQNTFNSGTFKMCADISGVAVRGCINPDNVLDRTWTVDIYAKAPLWRRGAINNLPELTYVSALAAGISRINPGALLNLPKLKDIQLTYNDIEEIPWGVFSNSTLESIDLSRNLISYVENEAFSNMPNLKALFLHRNKIKDVDRNWFANTYGLKTLRLAYNEIEQILFFTFSELPEMTYLDLSLNRIKKIGEGAFNNIKALNCLDYRNRLSWISTDIFKTKIEVKQLRLSLNRFSFLSKIVLERGSVKSVTLHPNPWQCPCLDDISMWMHQHNVTLIDPSDGDHRIKYNRNLPVCSFNPKSGDKCIVGYDDDFLRAQEIFLREVNYSESVWEKPKTEPPNYDHIITAPTFRPDLSPIS